MTERRSLTDPGPLLATTHQVGADLRVRLRLTRPSDAEQVHAFLSELSPETRKRRFFSATAVVPDALVRHFTYFDPRERLVVAATAPLDGEQMLGLADVVLTATGEAELGLVVDDRVQGQGLGTLLTEAVASLALRQGAQRLKAELLSENEPMLRVLERIGPTTVVTDEEDQHQVVYMQLPAARRSAA